MREYTVSDYVEQLYSMGLDFFEVISYAEDYGFSHDDIMTAMESDPRRTKAQ